MNDTDSDDLHDLLAQMADNGNTQGDAEAPPPPSDPAVELAAADLPAPPPVDSSADLAPPPRPAEKAATAALKLTFALVPLFVGALLLAWAVYGVLLLAGVTAVDRDNAQSMAKLMAFAAGPIGLILTAAGAATLRNWRRTRGNPR